MMPSYIHGIKVSLLEFNTYIMYDREHNCYFRYLNYFFL